MKGQLMLLSDRLLAAHWTINDQLKNISQFEHTRHRSPANFAINLLAGFHGPIIVPKKVLQLPAELQQLPTLL